ncbi:MAG: tRNA glutamyl-Q(34) synthetase GluQRS [Pseudomonadota bacterium]
MHVERFAPSPTGPLHLGHAYSALCAWQAARAAGGQFLVRLEDLDQSRVRPEWEAAIAEDLLWLGLDWDGSMLRQSTREKAYHAALQHLSGQGLTYGCVCTRRDIQQAISAPQDGVPIGPDGPVYPGTCRERGLVPGRTANQGSIHGMAFQGMAVRLNMAQAIKTLGGAPAVAKLGFEELEQGPAGQSGLIRLNTDMLVHQIGDIVLSRRDGAVAYHLAVVVDDAFQGVTRVTRGRDLFDATPIHRILQALLDLPVPIYRHHALVRDDQGKRLAKRDDARAIARYRADGLSPAEVMDLAEAGIAT